MDNLAHRYNRFLIFIFIIAPFVAYFVVTYLDFTFSRFIQFLSFIGVILLLIFRTKKNPIKIPTYLIFYFCFVLYVFYSAFIQLDRDFSFKYLFSNPLIGSFCIMFIIENMHFTRKNYKLLFTISKNILIIAIFVIFYQQIINESFFLNPEVKEDALVVVSKSTSRLQSIYSWAGWLTNGFGFVPIYLLVVEYLVKRNKIIIIWILFGVFYSILTKARWIMLITMLVFIIVIIHNKNISKQIFKYSLLIPLFLAISYFSLNAVGIDAQKILDDRILETNKTNDHKSATTRLLAFTVFNKLFWNNAIFGVGSIKYGMGATGKQDYKLRKELGDRSSQIHVGYLSLFYMYGLIGGFLFLTFLYLLLRRLYFNSKVTGIWAPFFGILCLAIANLTLVSFSLLEMGFIYILVANKYHLRNGSNIKEIT